MKPLLALLLLGTLSLSGAGLPKATLREASVTWGAGREPQGPVPPPRLGATLEVIGLPSGARPTFRVWRVPSAALKALNAGANPKGRRVGATALACTVLPTSGGFRVDGVWQGPVSPETVLAVEVFLGRRRVALATSGVDEHLLPATPPRQAPSDQ